MYFVKPISRADAASLVPVVLRYWQVMESLRGERVRFAA
jgi:hypothetical protein